MSDLLSTAGSCTHSKLSWYLPDKVIYLHISGDYTLEDSRQVNTAIIEELEHRQEDLVLVIDAMEMNRPYNFDQIRSTQTYMNHQNLKHIYAVTTDRVVKLALMIIFNISRAQLYLFDDIKAVNTALTRTGVFRTLL